MFTLLRVNPSLIGGLIVMIIFVCLVVYHWPWGKLIKGFVVGILITIIFIILGFIIFKP